MSDANPYDIDDVDSSANVGYIRYFPYRSATVLGVFLSVPEKHVRELRVTLHKQKCAIEGTTYHQSMISNHECFQFVDDEGTEVFVRFSDGLARFGTMSL